MKADERKELMTNTLAQKLGEAIQGFKEGPSRGTTALLVIVGVIVVLGLVWWYFSRSKEEAESARWLRWDSLTSADQLKSFAEDKDVQETLPGRLARFEEARRNLLDGLRELGSSGRGQALDNIKKAAASYDKLVDECADKPLLQQQALMGAAKAHESLGEIDLAKKYYRQLAQNHGNSVLGKDAEQQLQRLETAEQNGDLKALREEYNKPSPNPSVPSPSVP